MNDLIQNEVVLQFSGQLKFKILIIELNALSDPAD